MANPDIEKGITTTVRNALNGDKKALKALSLLTTEFSFKSIKKMFRSTPESKAALDVLAAVMEQKDSHARAHCQKRMPELYKRIRQ